MKNISGAYQLPCLFIRFNPDEYKTDSAEASDRKRHLRLKKTIAKYMNSEEIESTVGIIHLYFDGWTDNEPVNISILEGNLK